MRSFLRKIWGCGTLVLQKQAICESFLHENHIFHQFAKVFSLESFPLYSTSITMCQAIPEISRVCCHLYCYECAAWVTMPMATNKWYFSGIAWYYNDFIICMFRCSTRDLQLLDTDSHMTCSTDTDSRVTCNLAFYKLCTAARLPHWLSYIRVK